MFTCSCIRLQFAIFKMFFFQHASRNKAILIPCCYLYFYSLATDIQYDEDDDEITPDLWQEACWIVIRLKLTIPLLSF